MSVIVNRGNIDALDNIFIFYDFKQILDTIMIVTFVEKTNRWQKVFVCNSDDGWDITTLQPYIDADRYEWLCKKLDLIFQHRENSDQFEGIDISDIEKNVGFELAINAL